MTYQEAWIELAEMAVKAKSALTILANDAFFTEDVFRIRGKIEGVDLILDYMHELKKVIQIQKSDEICHKVKGE
jgi:hypothetical protein